MYFSFLEVWCSLFLSFKSFLNTYMLSFLFLDIRIIVTIANFMSHVVILTFVSFLFLLVGFFSLWVVFLLLCMPDNFNWMSDIVVLISWILNVLHSFTYSWAFSCNATELLGNSFTLLSLAFLDRTRAAFTGAHFSPHY